LASLQFFLDSHAKAWFTSLATTTQEDDAALKTAMMARFNGSDGLNPDFAIASLKQDETESVADYFTRIANICSLKTF